MVRKSYSTAPKSNSNRDNSYSRRTRKEYKQGNQKGEIKKYGENLKHLNPEDIENLNYKIISDAMHKGGKDWQKKLYFEPATSRVFLYLPSQSQKNSKARNEVLMNLGKDLAYAVTTREEETPKREKVKRRKGIEEFVGYSASAILGITGLLTILASPIGITGRVIGIPSDYGSIIGVGLLIAGLFVLLGTLKRHE